MTEQCYKLLEVPKETRGDGWFEDFLKCVPKAFFYASDPDGKPFKGPDGAHYLGGTTTPNSTSTGACIVDLLPGLIDNGVGFVVNPDLNPPDYVFSFGNLATYKMFGSFTAPEDWSGPRMEEATHVLTEEVQALIGSPSDGYLPQFIRKPLREFLIWVGIEKPRVVLANLPDRRSLAFNVTTESLKAPEGYSQVMNLILWHLPMEYTLLEWADKFQDASAPL